MTGVVICDEDGPNDRGADANILLVARGAVAKTRWNIVSVVKSW